MKMKFFARVIAIALLFLTWGCTNDSTSDLSDSEKLPENVTYLEHIKPIIDNNCTGCHNDPPVNGAPMPLTTFEFVVDAITHRPLIDKISKPNGAPGLMPYGGPRLPQRSIDIIIKWKNQGLQR